MVTVGAGLMVTLAEPVLTHDPTVTTTFRVVVPLPPAVKVTTSLVCPAVIVPLVTDQE